MADAATLIISAIAAMASSAGAIIAYKVYRRQGKIDQPKLDVAVRREGNICLVQITLINRSQGTWTAEWAMILRPLNAKIVSDLDLPQLDDGLGNQTPDRTRLHELKLTRKARMAVSVGRAGTHGRFYGEGDRHSETLTVLLPSWRLSRRLSILISLASNEADQRRTIIAVRRAVPAAPSKIKD